MGKVLIIKGADFSENAISKAFKIIKQLCIDHGDGSLQPYEGVPEFPIPSTNGIYVRDNKPGSFSHIADYLITDFIDVEDYSEFEVKSYSVNKTQGVVNIGFLDETKTSYIGVYRPKGSSPSTGNTVPTLGTVPVNRDIPVTVTGIIPEGAKYMVVGCYGATQETYTDFYVKLTKM